MINVLKANAQIEPFSEEKVINSIKRAGIPRELQEEALQHVESKLYDHISSGEVYHHIVEYLGHSSQPYTRSRYSLKQAIMALGPTGYPFEDFVAQIFQAQGYKVLLRQILWGKCVSHEIDVVLEKAGKKAMVEAKFHNNPGIRSDVHVPMYTQSRFQDIKEKHNLSDVWIATNTKVTSDAVAYAQCMGMKLLSWSYPEGESLREIIERERLQPITALTTISTANKQRLLEDHIVTCRDILAYPKSLDVLFLHEKDKEKVFIEAKFICDKKI